MTPANGELEGRVAVVTGGSRGLGREMCRAFAAQSATVVVASRKAEACEALAAELTEHTGRAAFGVGCHVGRWEDCDRLVEVVYERFGRIDILVNNAGMSPRYPSLEGVTEELFDKVIGVNLKGAFRLSATIGDRMRRDGGGAILNISSIAAVRPTPEELPYAAAKAGLNALTTGMAREFAPEVRVNAIMPGMFATDVASAWDPHKIAEAERQAIPLQRLGQPEEIVGAALHLVSDRAGYTTGTVMTVDGGLAL
jgi:NAD(P)-dependent dehydrogenase (short-subunit alcohol dehydrogenase family)